VRFGILTAVSIEKTEFWDATPCSLIWSYPHVSDDPTISMFRVEELYLYRGADKSLARPGGKQATTEDFDVHIYYL